ncbi:hypothetical protein COOONC_21722 [Cooperia oncophora]
MPAKEKERKDRSDRVLVLPTRYSACGHPCEQLVNSFNQFLEGKESNSRREMNFVLPPTIDLFKFHQMSEDMRKVGEELEKQSSDKKE